MHTLKVILIYPYIVHKCIGKQKNVKVIATKNSQAQWHSYNVNSIAEGDCLFEFNITVSPDILSLFCHVKCL